MDVTLQRHHAKFIYVVPDGLREIMSDISREILRSQPTDLYTFIADYLDALLITRENARVASRLISDIVQISQTTTELLVETGLTRSEANKAAALIQDKFRKFANVQSETQTKQMFKSAKQVAAEIIAEAALSNENFRNATFLIQKAFKIFMQKREKERALLGGMVDWRVAAKSAIALYRKTGATEAEIHRAATLIKSAYKGYYQRRVMTKMVEDIKKIESVECLCDMYSIDVPAIEPTRKKKDTSDECICSVDSELELGTELRRDHGCLCEYTESELIKIGKGEIVITDEGHTPTEPPESEEGSTIWCTCPGNPEVFESIHSIPRSVDEEIVQVKHVGLLYDDDENEQNDEE